MYAGPNSTAAAMAPTENSENTVPMTAGLLTTAPMDTPPRLNRDWLMMMVPRNRTSSTHPETGSLILTFSPFSSSCGTTGTFFGLSRKMHSTNGMRAMR